MTLGISLPNGLFHFRHMTNSGNSASKFENCCFSSKAEDGGFDDSSGLGEIHVEASNMKGDSERFPDQLEESAPDDSSPYMKTVTEDDTAFEGALEGRRSFRQRNVSRNSQEPKAVEDAEASVNLRSHAWEESKAAEPPRGQGRFSSHSKKNEGKDKKGGGYERHGICLNPELNEVCFMDFPPSPFETLRVSNQDSKVLLDERGTIRSRELNRNSQSKVMLERNVIIINDEDSDDEESFSLSAPSSSSLEINSISVESDGEVSSPSFLGTHSWNSVDSSYSDDDCLVVEQPVSGNNKLQRPPNRDHTYAANACNAWRHVVDDSSDCEMVVGSQDEIRMHWEDAAMRKRCCQPMQSKGSRVGREDSGMLHRPSLKRRDSESGRDQETSSHHEESGSERPAASQGFVESVATSGSSSFSSKREVTSSGDKIPPCASSVTDTSKDWVELDRIAQWRRSPVTACRSYESVYLVTQAGNHADESISGHGKVEKGGINLFVQSFDVQNQIKSDTNRTTAFDDEEGEYGVALESQHIVGDREKLKETAEFKKADAEEWARRQEVLDRQALEAQRMRKRKRADANRKLEMENRQKQRLLEIRETQQMEKDILGLKEHFRGEVRAQLERKSLGCIDMASLLRRLGIFVDGGAFPIPDQVNAAYKRAILRFHPDRAAALVQDDPRHQVEAEETFKLISRMKSLLPHVASQHFNLSHNGFQ